MFKTETAPRYWKLQDFQNNNNSLLISKAVKLVYIDIDNLYSDKLLFMRKLVQSVIFNYCRQK